MFFLYMKDGDINTNKLTSSHIELNNYKYEIGKLYNRLKYSYSKYACIHENKFVYLKQVPFPNAYGAHINNTKLFLYPFIKELKIYSIQKRIKIFFYIIK